MDANSILKFGLQIPCFLGVFELSDLPVMNVVKHNVCFIVIHKNHAIAVYIATNTIDVLDPLGPTNIDTFKPICDFLDTHIPTKILRMNSKIQSDISKNCALFCLLFLYMRCNDYSFQDSVGVFSCDYIDNDKIAEDMFNSFFTTK